MYRPHILADRISASIMSGILLILCFPNFDFGFLAWLALVPLFFAIKDARPNQAFLLGCIAGLTFYLGSIWWLIHVTLPGLILLCLYLALYFGVFCYLMRFTADDSQSAVLLIPAIWVALEYIRASFPTGFGWSLLGYSQYNYLPLIQIADITGAYGISFLIVMVNVSIYQLIVATRRVEGIGYRLFMGRHSPLPIILIMLVLGYGYLRLNQEVAGTPTIKVSIIQGNIPQEQKWDESHARSIFNRYYELTRTAAGDKPDLIIWPETAFPGYFGDDKILSRKVQGLVRRIGIPLLFGTPSAQVAGHGSGISNSAMLLDTRGELIQIYDKLRLVPFGEYVPFEKLLGFVHNLAHYPIAGFVPGREYTVFKMPEALRMVSESRQTFSVLICFEDIFPSLSRQFVKKGAAFLVNITNDAWFRHSSAPYQHVQASVFRAVENRVSMVRAANTGVSCFIDNKGRIVSRVQNRAGRDIFIEGYDTESIKAARIPSFYTRHGDLFAYICLIVFVVFLMVKAPPPLNRIFRL